MQNLVFKLDASLPSVIISNNPSSNIQLVWAVILQVHKGCHAGFATVILESWQHRITRNPLSGNFKADHLLMLGYWFELDLTSQHDRQLLKVVLFLPFLQLAGGMILGSISSIGVVFIATVFVGFATGYWFLFSNQVGLLVCNQVGF